MIREDLFVISAEEAVDASITLERTPDRHVVEVAVKTSTLSLRRFFIVPLCKEQSTTGFYNHTSSARKKMTYKTVGDSYQSRTKQGTVVFRQGIMP